MLLWLEKRGEIALKTKLKHYSRKFKTAGNNPYRVLFFGSDNYAVQCFESLLQEKNTLFSDVAVVIPHHSNVPLRKSAVDNSIEYFVAPKHGDEWTNWRIPTTNTQHRYDLACVVSFGYFLPPFLLNTFKSGTLNVHPSLLPKFRGSSPIQHAILRGDAVTGVSIIELDPCAFDSGKILLQAEVPIGQRESFEELHSRLAVLGSKKLIETIRNLKDLQANAVSQDESKVTIAPKLKPKDGLINWGMDSLEAIFTKFRAFGNKVPLYSTLNGKKVILNQIVDPKTSRFVPEKQSTAREGAIFYDKKTDTIFVKAKDGYLGVKELRVADKKTVGSKDFRNGYLHNSPIYFD